CSNLAFGYDKVNETFLRAVLEKNPHKDMKAEASLALGQYLKQRASLAKRMADEPMLAAQIESALGKEVAAELKATDLAKLEATAEVAFREFVDKYAADMKPEGIAQACQRLSFSADKSGQY